MSYSFPSRFIIFDTEFWADEDSMARKWSGPEECRDLIDIGCVIADDDLNMIGVFSWLIKPTLSLTPFITRLTGISQKMVDGAEPLKEVLPQFELMTRGLPIMCFGTDNEVVRENCERYGIEYPFENDRFTNLQPILKPLIRDYDPSITNSGGLIRAFGKQGLREHRGFNDSWNLLLAMQELRARGLL